MRAIKKPIEVDAFPWYRNGDHPEDYTESVHDLDGTVHSPEARW